MTICRFVFLFCLLLVGSLPLLAQKKTIRLTGTVLHHATKSPLPDVSIVNIRTNMGTASNVNGQFRLTIEPTDTILFRAIGYKPVLYVPAATSVSEIRAVIRMQADSVQLKAVEVSGRPSPETINRALRNMKPRPQPKPPTQPNPTSIIRPNKPQTPTEPTIMNPASLLYEKFSKEGKQKQKLEEIREQQQADTALKKKEEYNRFFKDNTGYE